MFRISRLTIQNAKAQHFQQLSLKPHKIIVPSLNFLTHRRNLSYTLFNQFKNNNNEQDDKDQYKMEIKDDLKTTKPKDTYGSLSDEIVPDEESDKDWFVDPDYEVLSETDFIPLWQRRAVGEHMTERLALQKASKDLMSTGNLTAESLRSILEESKLENVTVIDVKEKCDWAEYMIIASSSKGEKYLSSVAEHVTSVAKKAIQACPDRMETQPIPYIEGRNDNSGWILIDLGRIIIHLLTPEIRKHYDLEGLWNSVSTDPKKPMSINED
ncbi:MAG: Oligomerization domain-containing protein [Benjaminiella poitrasii]|nr:MAG: Oligomerization domain-containing protein [Benjaminiella poitrasii]